MIHNRSLLLGSFVVAVAITTIATTTTTTTTAFSPSQISHRRIPRLSAATLESTPTTTTPTLTEEDEAILFGASADAAAAAVRAGSGGGGNSNNNNNFNPLDRSTDPLVNALLAMRQDLPNGPALWSRMAQLCPTHRALRDDHLSDTNIDLTFQQVDQKVRQSAHVFQTQFGIGPGTTVAVLAENSAQWLLVDHGVQLAGGATAVRGADAPLDELRYIYEHSDSKQVVVLQGPKLLKKLVKDARQKQLPQLGLSNARHGNCQAVVLLHREKATNAELDELARSLGVRIAVFADLIDGGVDVTTTATPLPAVTRDDLATIVYTSGTTGKPKGVMLTHGNLLHQIGHRVEPTRPYEESEPLPGETMLSLLPVWHITERTFELWMLTRGANVVYSSIRTFKNDLAKHRPQWAVLVPRVLEKVATGVQDKFASGSLPVKALSSLFTKTSKAAARHRKIAGGLIVADEPPSFVRKLASKCVVAALTPLNAVGNKLVWSKVQDGFGGRMKCIMSGGSALAGALDEWYEAAGFKICVAYGLTECSPLISHRRGDANLVSAGCAGKPCVATDLRVVDPESKPGATPRPEMPIGEIGVVIAKGPQVMRGYYKNPEATDQAIDKFGFFDTGDLGRINPATGDLILTGRAKDTIVLSNGENIEPGPIEDAIVGSCSLIEQVMLVGQDGKSLKAICVLSPTELGNEGFLEKGQAASLQKENDKMNDPKCTEEDGLASAQVLNAATASSLRSNTELLKRISNDCRQATTAQQGFRAWEQVRDVHVTLEPYAMVNGQLTQSYKVKRASVLERYQDEL